MNLQFPKPKTLNLSKLVMPVWVEQKLDGWRMMIWKEHAYGRKQDSLGRWINLWPKLPNHIQALTFDFPVDGELIWPGKEASDVSTGLKERNSALQFIGFRRADQELHPHNHRRCLQALGFQTPTPVDLQYMTLEKLSHFNLKDLAIHYKYEGFVLKERYKVPTWWRYKLEETYDLIITDLRWPTAGKYKTQGWIKSLTCSAYCKGKLKVIANVSGMTDEVRSKITGDDVGRVVEVKANLFASQGKLKHPRFIRFRDDKNESECILQERK